MRYLLLVPSVVAMLGCVLCWTSLVYFKLDWSARVFAVIGAVSLQFAGIYIASLIDRIGG